MQTAATFTLKSPDSLSILYGVAKDIAGPTQAAEIIREVGLKCISFNGIPSTINCLSAFYASLPKDVTSRLSTTPSRAPTPQSFDSISARGCKLWKSIYAPFDDKLFDKLALVHPDLPVHILNSHYGPLLSDPPVDAGRRSLASIGRVLTSAVAVASLRAQPSVEPQLLSHIFGLRKAYEDGTWRADEDAEESVVRWLAGDEGNEWILKSVDRIVAGLGRNDFAEANME